MNIKKALYICIKWIFCNSKANQIFKLSKKTNENDFFKKTTNLPEEITFEEKPLIEITEGLHKGLKYQYEKNGQYYGGDFLNEPPSEIDLDLPPPPQEMNLVI